MKTKKINLIVFMIFAAILISIISTCKKDEDKSTPSLPTELLGTWSKTFGKSPYVCTQTWTFRQHDYTFAESCYSYDPSSYDDKVEEIFLNESMFRTPDDQYIVWHLEGNELYLYSTNPGDSKPTLSTDWWVKSSPYYKK
jgi:hypothetical protein